MHRFLTSKFINDTRVALRSDASIWLMAQGDSDFSVNRGGGWVRASRIRLCRDDQVRLGDSEVPMSELCDSLGIDYEQACDSTKRKNSASGDNGLVPVFVPASVIDEARRNPETGQIEPSTKEQT